MRGSEHCRQLQGRGEERGAGQVKASSASSPLSSCGITAPKRGCASRLKEVKVPTYWTDVTAYKESGQSQANWHLEKDRGLSHQWGQHLQVATTLTICMTLEASFNSSLSSLSRFSNGNPKRITIALNKIMMTKLPVPWRRLADTYLFPLGLSQYRLTPCVLHLPLVYRKV